MLEKKAINEMNLVAGLEGGWTSDWKNNGITCGYIGNIERWGDDRAWGFFHPKRHENRMIGRYASKDDLLAAFDANPKRFLDWANAPKITISKPAEGQTMSELKHDEELGEVLLDIASTGFNDPAPTPLNLPKPGPNNWANVTASDFGPCQDYDTWSDDGVTVISPVSNAALQWCYAHLPEDCPRWGQFGFSIANNEVVAVFKAMERDKLMSEDEYIRAMEEQQLIQQQSMECD